MELERRARPVPASSVDKSVDNVDNWEFGEFGEFVGQEPNNSVYLAPLTNIQRKELIASIISAYTSVTIKSFARPCIVIRRLVIFLNVPQNKR